MTNERVTNSEDVAWTSSTNSGQILRRRSDGAVNSDTIYDTDEPANKGWQRRSGVCEGGRGAGKGFGGLTSMVQGR